MQFHTENEILMCTYSYLHSRTFLTIITLLFMQYIPYCMTKLYITNDDSSQALFVHVDQPASRDFDTIELECY